jgi:hypothetical protein
LTSLLAVGAAVSRRVDPSFPQQCISFLGGTGMWQSLGWICWLVAMSCIPTPDAVTIQTAYEREESAGSALHDKGLKVLEAKCHDSGSDRFLCEVMFTSRDDPAQRLYFDIVSVSRVATGWELKSGLCKR